MHPFKAGAQGGRPAGGADQDFREREAGVMVGRCKLKPMFET